MCNVIHFYYQCQHTLRLRRSRCKGTKHKITRTSTKAACTAESFLTMYARTDCSACEHARWESDWTCKLERARAFLSKLIERQMPGANEVCALVKELDDQYYITSWNARNFSHTFKKSVARVTVSDYKTARSPLRQEVQPEDVVDSKEKDWAKMEAHEYDGDYIASTDPIHPVNTDYSHPLDDDDGSWILNHFSSEELEAPNDGELVLDLDQTGWSWDNGNSENLNLTAASQGENTASAITDNDLIAWGPEAEAPPMFVEISMNGLSLGEKLEKEQIELVIEAFWAVVNEAAINTDHRPQRTTQDSSILLCNLGITTGASKSPSSPSPPTGSPSQWVDGPSETPPPIQPSNPNSTRTAYNKQRKFLKERLQEDADKAKYYSDLLLVSRWEARAFEGPEGRFIPDPPMIRVHEERNGWFQ